MRLQEAVTRIAHSSSNSRTLGRVRLFLDGCFGGQLKFQFTHPGKGATGVPTTPAFRYRRFNSRTLGRVRRKTCLSISPKSPFQFTHPGKGATRTHGRGERVQPVSIHAPWEGCDHVSVSSPRQRQRFNSRTLGRVRRRLCVYISPLRRFNSRTLGRVRPHRGGLCKYCTWFQFTHPGKGATV